jgi:hypothetical protein
VRFLVSCNSSRVLSVLTLMLLMLCSGLAQTQPGNGSSITGTVTDQTQAVVPDAKAELVNQAKEKLEVQSDDKGVFTFKGLKPGTYTLTVTAPNFAPEVIDNLNITEGLELPLDVSLKPAGETTKVNVESSTEGRVETENATVSGTITQKEVVSYGLNGRNFIQLIALAPGVSNQSGQDEAKVGVVGSAKYSVNGGRVEYNTFEVDGSDVLNTGLSGAASTLIVYPSLDAIQEVKVLTSNYGAQYGRTASGTVQVTTKSGTGQFHGNLYDFVRNEVFNSRNYFDFGVTVPPVPGQLTGKTIGGRTPLYRRQDFGGTIGGPLTIPGVFNTKREKTFFFFSEEARLEKSPTEYNQAVPGLKERGLILTPQGIQRNMKVDEVTGVLYQDFDFTDVCPLLAPTFTRQQFPDCPSMGTVNGNFIPLLHLRAGGGSTNKNAIAILNSNLIPLPNAPFGCNFKLPNINSTFTNLDPADPNHCYNTTVSPSTYWREELFRIDHAITSNLKVSFRYVHDAWDTTVLTPQWAVLRNTFPTVQNRFVGPGTSLVARFTDVISASFLNDTVLSYTNSSITLTDQNGPGGAQFQRNPTLDQPLVVDSSAPGQCNPTLSVDPSSGAPQCAIGHIFNNGFGGKMPGINFLGTNAAYGGRGFAVDPAFMPWGHSSPTYAARDDVSKVFGKHTFQFGGQFVYSQRNQTNNAIGAASGDTQGLLTFSNLAHSTGNAFADFLLESSSNAQGIPAGFIQSFTQDSGQHRYYQRYQIVEPYFQDDWKVNNRLTVNLGLRLSFFGTYNEAFHNAWNWDPSQFNQSRFAVDPVYGNLLDKSAGSTPVPFDPATFQLDPGIVKDLGLVQCGTGGVPGGCMSNHWLNPAPRIGFAWDPVGDGKTSIRGGYGIFFEHGTGNEANTGSLEASAPLVLTVTQNLPRNFTCIGDVGYGTTFDPTNSGCVSSGPVGTAPPPPNSLFPIDVTSIPTHAVWPYAQQWSFGIQRELPQAFVATVSYVGSKGTHLTVARQLNQLAPLPDSENPFGPNEPLTIADCTVAPPSFNGFPGDQNHTPFLLQSGTLVTSQNPAYTYLQAACTNPNIPNVNSLAGRPYPGLGKIYSLQNVADSSYHALQFTIRHASGPLTVGLSYSYSHSLDDSSDRSDPILVNSYDLRENHASSSFDQRHLVNISYVYQLPLRHLIDGWNARADDINPADLESKCCSSFWNHALDGWELSGVTTAQSGTPFTVINSAGNRGISLTDNAGVSSGLGIAASYPDIINPDTLKGLTVPGNNPSSVGPLIGNPAQFVAPRGLTFGNAGRNYLNNPGRVNFDMALLKHFPLGEGKELQFRAEAFNVFNNTQFRIYDPDNPGSSGNNVISCYAGPNYSAGFKGSGADCITGASFLHPINAHRPRTFQFGLKLAF